MKHYVFKSRDVCTGKELAKTEQNLNLAAAYIKINEEGRVILDMVIQKLGEIHWPPKIDCMRRTNGMRVHTPAEPQIHALQQNKRYVP